MTLYIVSTPIGNLKDLTLRAIEILTEADLILAEDTRRTGILLNQNGIKTKMESYNDNNKEKKTQNIIKLLNNNLDIAIVSDSGTPGISDPGFYLVREAVKHNIQISPIPGPNAVISALVSSGLPTDKFAFYGFIPKKGKENYFKSINNEITSIFYESPHRITKTLELLAKLMPNRNICICREMTKKFEEFIRGTCKEVYDKLKDKSVKGEITIVLSKSTSQLP